MGTPELKQVLEKKNPLERLAVDPKELAEAKAALEERLTTLWRDQGFSEEEARERASVD